MVQVSLAIFSESEDLHAPDGIQIQLYTVDSACVLNLE